MARSERTSRLAIPLATRSSEVTADCHMQTFLQYMFEDDYSAAWFHQGTVLHEIFESALRGDITRDEAHERIEADWALALERHGPAEDWLTSTKRPLEAIPDIMHNQLETWWEAVLGLDKHFMFDGEEMEWDIELPIVTDDVTTRPDAILTGTFAPPDGDSTDYRSKTLIDWKTGSSTSHDPRQLQFYWFALEDQGIEVDDAVFVSVLEDKIHIQQVYRGSRMWYEMALREARVRKENQLYTPAPGWYCKYCTVKPECVVFNPRKEEKIKKLLERSYLE